MKIENFFECDILVVGSGIGGLTAGKKSDEKGMKTILVTSGKICGGASYFPLKGTLGIQATAEEEKDKELFFEDIRGIGKGMDNPHMINAYINDIRKSIGYLNEIGFEPWLRDDKRPACFAKYARDIYLIKDWDNGKRKGEEIFKNLENTKIIEESRIVKILKDENKITGAVFQKKNGSFFIIKTPVIIMATGGIGGLYEHNLYPKDVDGTGHTVLLDAGAKAQNMEFIQFIPAFIKPVYNTLFGEHTLKYCLGMYNLKDEKIYPGIDDEKVRKIWEERSSYAPFSCDLKSHEIDLKMVENPEGVKLKFSRDLYKDEGEFYRVYLNWLKNEIGIHMCEDEIVITPFAHSCNGGIKVSDNGETGVGGLFAVGELLSGVEGANRLGGNSVGGALVFGKRAVDTAEKYLQDISEKNIEKYSKEKLEEKFKNWLKDTFNKNIKDVMTKEEVIKSIKHLVTEKAGIKRNGVSLEEGLKKIEDLRNSYNILENLEDNSLDVYFKLETAKLLFTAMLNRKESRGAHYREDYPFKSNEIYRIVLSKEKGKIKADKVLV